MRPFLLYLLLLAFACSCSRHHATSPPLVPHRLNCPLDSLSAPANPAYEDTQQAVAEFRTQVGRPYAALYLEKREAHPDRARCVRVLQRAADTFTLYRYAAGQRDSLQLTATEWQTLLTNITPGHFTIHCDQYRSSSTLGVLLVKYETTTPFSLVLDVHEWDDFAPGTQARLRAGYTLLQRLRRLDADQTKKSSP